MAVMYKKLKLLDILFIDTTQMSNFVIYLNTTFHYNYCTISVVINCIIIARLRHAPSQKN